MADQIHEKVSEKRDLSPTSSDPSTSYGPQDQSLLDTALFPEDSYHNGVYWSDLPKKERHAWINRQSNAEAKRELKAIGSMAKADPLSPIGAYFSRYVANGMGLFVEGYGQSTLCVL